MIGDVRPLRPTASGIPPVTIATPGDPYVLTDFSLSNDVICPMYPYAANPLVSLSLASTGMEIETLGPQNALGRQGMIFGTKLFLRIFPDNQGVIDYEITYDRLTQLAVVGQIPAFFVGNFLGGQAPAQMISGVHFGSVSATRVQSSLGDIIALLNTNPWNDRVSTVVWAPDAVGKSSGKINIRYIYNNTINPAVSSYMTLQYRYADLSVGPGYSAWQVTLDPNHYQWSYTQNVQGVRPIMGVVMSQTPQAGYRCRFTEFKVYQGRIFKAI